MIDLEGRMLLPGSHRRPHACFGPSAGDPQRRRGGAARHRGALPAGRARATACARGSRRSASSGRRACAPRRPARRCGTGLSGVRAVLTCGKIVSATAPGGRFYGDMYREADGPDDVRRAVREQIRAGADFIKVMTTGARSNEMEDPDPLQLTDEEFAALVDESHRMGYRVAAHAEGLDGCEAAIRHGMDTIEHGMYLHQRPGPARDDGEATASSSCRRSLATTGWPGWARSSTPTTPCSTSRCRRCWSSSRTYNLEQGALTMRAAKKAGVKIALGSDADTVGLELLRMIHHGLTPREALVAATGGRAGALGLDEHVGTIEEGKLADLLIVDGDALSEPELLCDPSRIWLVLQLGAPVAGQALERALAGFGDQYA